MVLDELLTFDFRPRMGVQCPMVGRYTILSLVCNQEVPELLQSILSIAVLKQSIRSSDAYRGHLHRNRGLLDQTNRRLRSKHDMASLRGGS